jgi:hypothetical protein
MLKGPKNIVVEDMKILAGKFGLDENEKKNRKWKIIGIISLIINAFFIFSMIYA